MFEDLGLVLTHILNFPDSDAMARVGQQQGTKNQVDVSGSKDTTNLNAMQIT